MKDYEEVRGYPGGGPESDRAGRWLKGPSVGERWSQGWQQNAGFRIQVSTSRVRVQCGWGKMQEMGPATMFPWEEAILRTRDWETSHDRLVGR